MTPAGAEKAAFQMRSLRPVSARIVSYGRENQSRRRPTLYVLRVSRSGAADWYVAKRYSEFRALHDALLHQFNGSSSGGGRQHPSCGACEELASFYGRVRFPERHVLQSKLGISKQRLDATRMEELDSYVRFLLETTQGLLGDEDEDDEDAPEWDGNESSRCLPLDLIREFLMVNEDHAAAEDAAKAQQQDPETSKDRRAASAVAPAVPRRQLHRLTRRSSSVTSFHVRELDLVSAEKKSSPTGDSMRNLFAEDWWDPTFADVFDECAAPPEDAFIHRQVEDAPTRTHPLRLIESFPRR